MSMLPFLDEGSTTYRDLEGLFHRDGGPAQIEVYHRPDGGPEPGCFKYECWYQHGEIHRTDGPARIWYDIEGTIVAQEWWLDHDLIEVNTQQEFDRLVKLKAFW